MRLNLPSRLKYYDTWPLRGNDYRSAIAAIGILSQQEKIKPYLSALEALKAFTKKDMRADIYCFSLIEQRVVNKKCIIVYKISFEIDPKQNHEVIVWAA